MTRDSRKGWKYKLKTERSKKRRCMFPCPGRKKKGRARKRGPQSVLDWLFS